MLADLLEKKSNPPVQVIQMSQQQMNAPTIQITETGQIVQIKSDSNPILQINDPSQIIHQAGQFIQIKNEQGQIIHLKNDQFQSQVLQMKNEPGHIVQNVQAHVKAEDVNDVVINDHSYTEPPMKKVKLEEKTEVCICFNLSRVL